MSAQLQHEQAPQVAGGIVTQLPLPRKVTLDLDDAQRMEEMLVRFRDEILVRGVDYGFIPKTPKATLYKPGGEKLLQFFSLGFTLEVTRDEDWAAGRVAYEVKAIIHDKKTKDIVTEGVGSCNSQERNYKNKAAADVANTCLKMAKKRALLDGVLTATCSSGLFEDGDEGQSYDYSSNDRQGDRSRQGNQNQGRGQQQGRNQAPAKPRAATRDELARCERARSRAIQLGYKTAQGGDPKPLADGTPVDEASAKCTRWETFIRQAETAPAEKLPDPQTVAPPTSGAVDRGPQYQIPKHTRQLPPHNCTSCGAEIWFVKNPETGKTVPVNKDGYSHFTTCPNASQHSKKAASPYPLTAPQPGAKHPLTNAQKRLWAVIGINNLPQAKEGAERDERIEMCNQALVHANFEPITSFAQLSDNEAQYLVAQIEAGRLAWCQGAEVTA